jgi:dynein heavy chain
VQPRDAPVAGAQSADELVVAAAQELEARLPALLDLREAGPTTFAAADDEDVLMLLRGGPGAEDEDVEEEAGAPAVDSLAEFLKQEVERCNAALRTVQTTLRELQRAVRGQVVMSAELDTMHTALLNNQVPHLWARVSPPSLKPLAAWIVDLHARAAALRDWLRNGKPACFWLSGFFFQQGFLTGVLQTHARRYRIPIDSLSFSFAVLPHLDPAQQQTHAEDGVFVHGLYTAAAQWSTERGVLEDAPAGTLVAPLPILHLLPREHYTPRPDAYVCPVYKTAVRAGVLSTTGHSTNFVVDVHLPTEKHPDYWVLKGVAILCQPDSG